MLTRRGLTVALATVVVGGIGAYWVRAESISGTIKFEGERPKRTVLKTKKDPNCAKIKAKIGSYNYVISKKSMTVANVIVYLDHQFEQEFEIPSVPVVLNQTGCEYSPHVVVMRTGQALHVLNNDATAHNIHSLSKKNPAFNYSQPNAGMKKVITDIKRVETFKVKCDVHPWMGCYIGAFDHPFFAVTGKDGTFSIADVPPGSYKLTAWQEEMGKLSMDVTVAAGNDLTAQDFTFKKK